MLESIYWYYFISHETVLYRVPRCSLWWCNTLRINGALNMYLMHFVLIHTWKLNLVLGGWYRISLSNVRYYIICCLYCKAPILEPTTFSCLRAALSHTLHGGWGFNCGRLPEWPPVVCSSDVRLPGQSPSQKIVEDILSHQKIKKKVTWEIWDLTNGYIS